MSDPLSLQILEAVRDRLQAIEPDSFNTDAGARVFLGRRRVNPDQLDIGPVLNVYDEDDEVDPATACGEDPMHVTMTVSVDGFVRDFDNESTRLLHLLTQDVKTAVLDLTDRTLGGLSRDLGYLGRSIEYPDPGGDTLTVTLSFTILYEEPYGTP